MELRGKVVIIFLHILLALGENLTVEEATYEVKEINSFGLDVKYAEHTIRFNKEIGMSVPVICPGFDCSVQDEIDASCLCNYASKNPAVCGVIPGDCPNTCDLSYCNT
jgi:hypothetical protein